MATIVNQVVKMATRSSTSSYKDLIGYEPLEPDIIPESVLGYLNNDDLNCNVWLDKPYAVLDHDCWNGMNYVWDFDFSSDPMFLETSSSKGKKLRVKLTTNTVKSIKLFDLNYKYFKYPMKMMFNRPGTATIAFVIIAYCIESKKRVMLTFNQSEYSGFQIEYKTSSIKERMDNAGFTLDMDSPKNDNDKGMVNQNDSVSTVGRSSLIGTKAIRKVTSQKSSESKKGTSSGTDNQDKQQESALQLTIDQTQDSITETNKRLSRAQFSPVSGSRPYDIDVYDSADRHYIRSKKPMFAVNQY